MFSVTKISVVCAIDNSKSETKSKLIELELNLSIFMTEKTKSW